MFATDPDPGDTAGDCPDELVHPATITVIVSDGKGESCTVIDPHGSAPVPPFDPGEDCKDIGPRGLTPAEAVLLSDRVQSAIGQEERAGGKLVTGTKKAKGKAAAILETAALLLDRVEGPAAEHGGTSSIEQDVHEASELDREAASDIRGGDVGSAKSKLDKALARKKAAKAKLDAIAGR